MQTIFGSCHNEHIQSESALPELEPRGTHRFGQKEVEEGEGIA